MTFPLSFQPAPDEFPNHLAGPEPERLQLPAARWLVAGLVLLCLAPRIGMALRLPGVCPDGVLYIQAARALEAGDFREAFREMSLNIYPVVLMVLHRLGLDWELGAVAWGVTVSSLVVLPLWGWVRRQFDDRVALVACLLYIVHPKFIEWSPEVMRDPTFWLLFMLSIYWLWRAVAEVRLGYFIAAGAGITLASLTRIEGLFLLIPLALWTFWRLRALKTSRRKLLLGAVLCLVVFPALLLMVNLVWLYGHAGFAALRISPLARIQPWLHSLLGRGDAAADGGEALDPNVHWTFGRMLWVYFPILTRGLTPIYALLMFGGLWGWRRVWARRDHQPLFYTTLVILFGIWVQLWYDKNICPRYMLPVVLMASPFAALGLLALMVRLMRIVGWLGGSVRSQRITAAAVVVLVLAAGVGDAMTGNAKYFETRRMAAEVGRWVRQQYAAPPMIVGPVVIAPIANYYAHFGPAMAFRWEADDDTIMTMVEQYKADVVLLRVTKELTPERCDALAEKMRRFGLYPVAPGTLPAACGDIRVLLRGKGRGASGRQSQTGTGSVASMIMCMQTRLPATVPVPFCDGPPACREKRGTGTVAMTLFPMLPRFAPRSQSPFFR